MKFSINSLSIRLRLMLGFGILGFLLLCVVILSWVALDRVQSHANRIIVSYEPQVNRMTQVELLMIKISLEARHTILAAKDPPELQAALKRIQSDRLTLIRLIDETQANLSTKVGSEIMSNIRATDAVFWRLSQLVVEYAQAGQAEEAYA